MSNKVILLRGLPGSGKSTFAKDLEQNHGFVRVNKDDIRKELGMDRKSFTRQQEYSVVDKRDDLICKALEAGKNVVVDDTNFGKKHEPRVRELAKRYNAEFVVKEVSVPVEMCIARDKQRYGTDGYVGEDVIWGMAEQHLGIKRPATVEKYVPEPGTPKAVICDLDGTLAIHQGRSPYDFEKCDTDVVNDAVRRVIKLFDADGATIIYVSGRDDSARDKTYDWLMRNDCPDGPLYMRETGDTRNDAVVKLEIFNEFIRGSYDVWLTIDDRDRVVKLWRDLGLTCLQAGYGAF